MHSTANQAVSEAPTKRTACVGAMRTRLRRALQATVGIAGFATFLGFLAALGWPFELFCHFRVQYAIVLGGAAIGAAALRSWRLAAIAAAATAVNFAQFATAFAPFPAPEIHEKSQIVRIMTFNVGVWNSDFERVLGFIRQVRPDFVVLIEVNGDWPATIERLEGEYAFTEYLEHESTFGIALLSRYPKIESRVELSSGSRIPVGIYKIDVRGQPLTIIAAHTVSPPQRELLEFRDHQLRELATIANGCTGPVVLAGDLNCTPWSPAFRRLIADTGLGDSRRGFGIQATWPVQFFPARIPIDHCLISREVAVQDRQIGPNLGSDHFPVIADLVISPLGDDFADGAKFEAR